MSDFSTILKRMRTEKGWSQTELARRLNVSKQAVSKWETGNAMPDMLLMPKIAELFNVSINELMTGKPHESESNIIEKEVVVEKIVEKEVVVEKEVIKKPSVKKICAIVAPILIVCIVAAALMGVYISKAIAAKNDNRNEVDPGPDPKPSVITYKDCYVERCEPVKDEEIRTEYIDGVAYYRFVPPFNSDYKFEIYAPLNSKLYLNDEYVFTFDIKTIPYDEMTVKQYCWYLEKGKEYRIAIDANESSVQTSAKYNWTYMFIFQKGDFENITIPANSDYVVALETDIDEWIAQKFVIKSDGVKFTDLKRQKLVGREQSIIYIDDDVNVPILYPKKSIELFLQYTNYTTNESTNYEAYENEYYFITLTNSTANDVIVEIVEEDIPEIFADVEYAYGENAQENIGGYEVYKIKVPEEKNRAFYQVFRTTADGEPVGSAYTFLTGFFRKIPLEYPDIIHNPSLNVYSLYESDGYYYFILNYSSFSNKGTFIIKEW